MTDATITKARRLLSSGNVMVKFASDQLVLAAVRGDSGIYDLRWTTYGGWSCSCQCHGRCSHIAAVDLVCMKPVTRTVPS